MHCLIRSVVKNVTKPYVTKRETFWLSTDRITTSISL